MSESVFNLDDFQVGDRVWAFHPDTLGCLHWASVEKVGRKYLHVDFTVTNGKVYRIPAKDVVRRELAR